MKMSFVVLGCPVPKARARACKDGKHRTPKKTRQYEKLVRDIARWHVPPGWPLDGAYRLTVEAFFPDFQRRDVDNVQKSIADALNKIAYHDDSQITRSGEGGKTLGDPNPRAEVTVEYLGPMPTRAEGSRRETRRIPLARSRSACLPQLVPQIKVPKRKTTQVGSFLSLGTGTAPNSSLIVSALERTTSGIGRWAEAGPCRPTLRSPRARVPPCSCANAA